MKFQNKIVWITGASSGLGRFMALEFARQGATVVVSARRVNLLNELTGEITREGGKALAIACDVTGDQSVAACVRQIVETYQKLDVVVANAGVGVIGKVDKLTDKEWRRQFDINVFGVINSIRHSLPYLRTSKGRLAMIGSVGAFIPGTALGAYGASKIVVHSLGETLQVELGGSGVSVTTIHPGFVESNIARIDNEGNFHPDKHDPRPANLMWPTDRAARVMVNAIFKRKKVFIFPAYGRVMVWLSRMFPALIRKMGAKMGAEPK